MAGHSQFKNIMYRKGAQDAKRANRFAKISREITVAAKSGGPDAESNPRLRLALQNARSENMPKDNIERALKKAAGGDVENYEEVVYEGYGPGGAALIVETLTDNRNRTGGNVRSAFSKHGGRAADSGAVAFKFDRIGRIVYPAAIGDADTVLEAAAEAGADDCESDADHHVIVCRFEALNETARALEARFGPAASAAPDRRPQVLAAVSGDDARTLLKLIDVLEDDDDVQHVFCDADFPDDAA